MAIHIRRVYDPPTDEDGRRILVDRLWPRGLSKKRARIDYWARDVSPSTELRRWYGHDPDKWPEFKARYAAELDTNAEGLKKLREAVGPGDVILVYSSKERRLNNAYALREYLEPED
ncbi:MAG: DUF488 family protein [Thermoanaerobaculia bacterium]